MLNLKEILTKILVYLKSLGTVQTALITSKITAPSVSSSYTYTTISGLSRWSMVVAHFVVNNVAQYVVFYRPYAGAQIISDSPSGTVYYRGGVSMDWTNNKLGIRCISGTTASNVYVDALFAVF